MKTVKFTIKLGACEPRFPSMADGNQRVNLKIGLVFQYTDVA